MLPILLVDDDVDLCALLEELLTGENFRVDFAHNGISGAEKAVANRYAVVVLDVMLPKLNGLDVLKRIREKSMVPVLMLTAKGSDADRITGLELGADDYLPKPFNPRELVARLRAILRRTTGAEATAGPQHPVRVADLELRPDARHVSRSGEEVPLTSAEFDLLHTLLRSPGKVISREELTEASLGRPMSPMDRAIDVHVSNLRRKLGPYENERERIKAIRGSGYVYVLPGEGD